MIKRLMVLILVLIPLLTFATSLPTKKYSIDVEQTGTREVLENILSSSGLPYEIDPLITNENKITVKAIEQRWSNVFKDILKQTQLNYKMDKAGKIHVTK
jgi:type II secretory pathway component GspD/PulD (secretin)